MLGRPFNTLPVELLIVDLNIFLCSFKAKNILFTKYRFTSAKIIKIFSKPKNSSGRRQLKISGL